MSSPFSTLQSLPLLNPTSRTSLPHIVAARILCLASVSSPAAVASQSPMHTSFHSPEHRLAAVGWLCFRDWLMRTGLVWSIGDGLDLMVGSETGGVGLGCGFRWGMLWRVRLLSGGGLSEKVVRRCGGFGWRRGCGRGEQGIMCLV
ncbi:hypothetical protein Droror1_Dr00008600 [Drosera rotundifolia]